MKCDICKTYGSDNQKIHLCVPHFEEFRSKLNKAGVYSSQLQKILNKPAPWEDIDIWKTQVSFEE